ncbi:MAG: MBL fold metallo-hydrolase [Gammaproteobacteria bacterium]|nr:MBL fold metallo-hydrolase [Gammaproteobacteria bacterium]
MLADQTLLMIRTKLLLLIVLSVSISSLNAQAQQCDPQGVRIQILGSGGPELRDDRSASSFLVWQDGKPRILVDVGGGAALRFYSSGAKLSELDSILFTHLHVGHSGDLAALINAGDASRRSSPLPIYGPDGNQVMPSTVSFVRSLFDQKRGAFRHLGNFLSPLGKQTFKLKPYDLSAQTKPARAGLKPGKIEPVPVYSLGAISIFSIPLMHNSIPTLAYRINIENKVVVFGSDISQHSGNLEQLAKDADILVMGHGILESGSSATGESSIPPSVVGRIAYRANVKQLVLVHRTTAMLGREKEILEAIKDKYAGLITFANDMDCFQP